MKPLYRHLIQLGAHIGETVKGTNHFTDYYVFGIRNSYYIIDLSKTIIMLRYALRFLRNSSVDGCSSVMYYYSTVSYEIITLFLYKLSRLLHLNILYQRWIPGSISNYYSCFYDLLNEIQDLNWVDARKKISFIDIFFKLLYYISIDKPVNLTLEEQYERSLSYWRAAIFFRYFRNYYYLPDIAICIDSVYSNKIYQEFSSLGIPVIAPLNTKSNFKFVSYPIISNNSSVLLGLFYFSLFSSAILDGRRIQYGNLFRNVDNKVYSFVKNKILKDHQKFSFYKNKKNKRSKNKRSAVVDKKKANAILEILMEAIRGQKKEFADNKKIKTETNIDKGGPLNIKKGDGSDIRNNKNKDLNQKGRGLFTPFR
jgi:small subunit ribosomal protein S2